MKGEKAVFNNFRHCTNTTFLVLTGLGALLLAVLSGCASNTKTQAETRVSQPDPGHKVVPPATSPTATPAASPTASSLARSPKEYRKDAASHLYGINKARVYKGRLPPMLQAVGVLDVDIDRQGQVRALSWKRAPKHAPEVMAEIERMVKAAAPYPAPRHLSQVTYTDVWLWHKSGKFQLDTLTEGQD